MFSHNHILNISKHQSTPSIIKVDLALLSMCSHTIMDYGTFGLWGGLLAGGEILAPTGYTRSVVRKTESTEYDFQLSHFYFHISKLSLSNFHFHIFTFKLSHFHFQTFTLSLSHFHFHTFTSTLSLSHFHFHTLTFTR